MPSTSRTSLKFNLRPTRRPLSLRLGLKLGLMHWVKRLDRLDFQHQGLFDNDIHFQIAIDSEAFVDDWQLLLSGERHPGLGELMT
jgi:hypothetical protein